MNIIRSKEVCEMNLTIIAWVVWLIIVLCVFGVAMLFLYTVSENSLKEAIWKSIVATIIIGAISLFGFNWYYTNTASGERARKNQDSNLNYGLNRRIEVYDATGNLIKTYEGKFDVEYDSDRIVFDDENRLRHIIYYPTGTVIIDEIE